MNNSEEQLLKTLARRNWVILLVMVSASYLLAGKDVALAAGCGGLIAVCGYQWLYASLCRALSMPGQPAVNRFQRSYIMRLGALVVMLVLLVAVIKVNPLGLVIGLSVVVVNILLTTLGRVIL